MTTSHARGGGGWRARSIGTPRQQPSCRGIGATDIGAVDGRHGLHATNGRPSSEMTSGDCVIACASVERD